ncbi:exonuclease SbcCD subunit D [Geosporobacter ferrireducens]|uniref:exonuclease SbcCD subunit D n=1 Tax=Geosporobacter ferrireducens TaxID=1424294 RepID=UPI00139E8594|nr:exonuclease SbcCD subunit D [Geosporobacter ferrireducens]MTI55446.1 exonuclease SbcCD subunit D [Geosporobacter ferrireducens]
MKILHTSDWHLGRILHGIHLTEDQAYILDQFIALVQDTKPDAILIAGDVFDRSVPPTEAVNLLDEVVSKILMDLEIPIIMIAGNHDSPDRLGFGYRLLESRGLNISGKLRMDRKPVVLYDAYGPVYFHAIPYAEPAMVKEHFSDERISGHDDAMGRIIQHIQKNKIQNSRNVLLAHAFVAGGVESESERPLSVGGSTAVSTDYFKDFNYVALGHLHKPQRAGAEHIRYSGSLMKYSFSEADHTKTVNFIEMDETGNIRLEYTSLKPKRDVRCVEGYLQDLLARGEMDENKADYLKVTLLDEGAILDAIGKLRKVYPNVLHIERPQLTAASQLVGADRDFKKMNELHLFSSFLSQVTEREITEEQQKAFQQVIDHYYRMIREE